jgi:hypothetical protein
MQRTTENFPVSRNGRILRRLCFPLAKLLTDWLDNGEAAHITRMGRRLGLRIDGLLQVSGHVQLGKVAAERTRV